MKMTVKTTRQGEKDQLPISRSIGTPDPSQQLRHIPRIGFLFQRAGWGVSWWWLMNGGQFWWPQPQTLRTNTMEKNTKGATGNQHS